MTHAYYHLIRVENKPGHYGRDEIVLPTAFTWRGERYIISHVNEPWHLMDRWWEPVPETWQGGNGRSDRWYYRVIAKVPGHRYDIIADIYHDRAQGCWVLERVLD